MTDPFAKPDVAGPDRVLPPLCRATGPDGRRCHLYRDHRAEFHRDKRGRWPL